MRVFWTALAVVSLGGIAVTTHAARTGQDQSKKDQTHVFELRTYHVAPGKMQALNARFRDHTNRLFKKHGMTVVGFWTPDDPKEAESKLIYVLSFPSREAAEKSWKAFRDDPNWKAVRERTEKDGKLVERVDSIFLNATDYSPLK